MPILWKVFDFFANNKTAQWVLAIVSGLALYKMYERLRDNRIRKQVEEKIEIEAQDKSRQVIAKAEEKTHDVIEKADEARADIPRGAPSGELPKHVQDILCDD